VRVFRNRSSEKSSGDAPKQGGPGHASVPDPLAVATERVNWVRRAAERARTDIAAELARMKRARTARDGEATGHERLEEQLAGTLAERTAALATEASELARMLERAEGALARAGGPPTASREGLAEVGPSRIELSRGRRFRRPAGERQIPEAARRLAAQMVASGASPEEISARLHRDYGLEDFDAVLGLIRA
jgi:hypothetical protein